MLDKNIYGMDEQGINFMKRRNLTMVGAYSVTNTAGLGSYLVSERTNKMTDRLSAMNEGKKC